MKYAIVYASQTGNTKLLAEAVRDTLPQEDLLYFGEPCAQALEADRIYVGFWTDKGSCDGKTQDFLKTVVGQQIFLFGTAGFGGDPAYYEKILAKVKKNLGDEAQVVGTYMCQGKMPMSVRERYVKMLENPVHMPNLKNMIHNFDLALSHPDSRDLENLVSSLPAAE